ncbi:MAG TPA: ABC transporter permease, partial [Parafilimonas sp.]|nr:ABC transporter permease [Parafilimonas sp.]
MWVQDELSYDSFHHNAANIYKINSHLGTGDAAQVWEGSPAPLAVFSKQVPEVQNAVRVNNFYEPVLFTYKDKKFKESNLAFVDPQFFSVFDFKLLQGDRVKPFPEINSIIVTSSEAHKYFGDANALGQVLTTDYGDFRVSGVMQDFPENSSMKYDMIMPMAFYAGLFTKWGGNGDWKTIDEDLGNFSYHIYLQLQRDASSDVVAKKLTTIFHDKKGPESKDDFFTLQPLRSSHLVAADGSNGALQTVRIFFVVAILILCIACINYVNLSTARAMLRSKEVSVRKIIGAARFQLFMQFIAESALLFLLASWVAFALIYLLLPLYNDISGKHLLFTLANKDVWFVSGFAIVATLIMASVYPALLLSSFKPIQSLKGKLSFGIGNTSFRKVLVVTQFIFSVGLIIATIVVSYQMKFVREKNLGFDKEHVFSFTLTQQLHDHFDAALAELRKQPGISGIASSGNSIAGVNSTTGDTYWNGKKEGSTFLIHPNSIDQNFIPLLKMHMVSGQNFTGSKEDSTHFILNETAVRQAGIKDPIGKNFSLWDLKGTIIGVVNDFNYASLKEAIEPAIFYYNPPNWRIYIKTTAKDAAQAIAGAQKVWKQFSPDYPFEYSFLDDDFSRMYQADQRTGTLFNVFAAVAILISCLGLFGLATYTAQVKTKEIGIRKVLGATVTNITQLLAKEFIVLVFISFVIAAPVAWFAMNKWLENYAYRVHISWWIFFVTGVLATAIALLTVTVQAIKAAVANPVKSLRTE